MKKRVILDLGAGAGERAVELAKRSPDAEVYGFERDLDHFKELDKLVAESGLKNLHFIKEDFRGRSVYDEILGKGAGKKEVSEVEMNFTQEGIPEIPEEVLKRMAKDSRIVIRIYPGANSIYVDEKKLQRETEKIRRMGFRVVLKTTDLHRPKRFISIQEALTRKVNFNYPTIVANRGKKPAALKKAWGTRRRK